MSWLPRRTHLLSRRGSRGRRGAGPGAACGLAAAGLVFAWAAPASAHNGAGAAFAGTAGPFTVYAYDGVPDQPGQLLYSAIVKTTATGLPVDRATVMVGAQLSTLDGHLSRRISRAPAEGHANVYQYELADPRDRVWLVHLTVTADARTESVSYRMHGTGAAPAASRQPGWDSPAAVGGATGGAVLLMAGGLILRRRGASR